MRKEIKARARRTLKQNYWKTLIVILCMAIAVGKYQTALTAIVHDDETVEAQIDISEYVGAELPKNAQDDNFHITQQLIGETFKNFASNGEVAKINRDGQAARGILAPLYNTITADGSILFGIMDMISCLIQGGSALTMLLVVIGTLLTLAFTLFVKYVLEIGEARYFLESRRYKMTKVESLLYPYKVRRTMRIMLVQLVKTIYQILWNLTIVGGFVKWHAYRLVPYIMAENPDLSPREAITLSRQMMDGYKWESFKFELSFLPWELLGACTLGVLNLLWVNPYKETARAELYMNIRESVKAKNFSAADVLGDELLDIECMVDERYPIEKYESVQTSHLDFFRERDWNRVYPLRTYILFFFTFSMMGWLWEVGLHIISYHTFVNRGVLHGPWLPIYGVGGVLIIFFLRRFGKHPFHAFLMSMVICGTIEYVTSWALEMFLGQKWWDYSGYLLNLNSRICLEGLLTFGIGGCVFIYVLAPYLDDLYKRIRINVQWVLGITLVIAFVVDCGYSAKYPNTGHGVTDCEARIEVEAEQC